MKCLLSLCVTVVALLVNGCFCSTASVMSNAAQTIERNLFAAAIYKAVGSEHLNENVVISPAAIQISMALAFYGAKGRTATELQDGIRLGSSNPEEVVRRFGEYQQSFTRYNNIRLANQIYINENLEFKGDFKNIAQRNFDSSIEKVDFHPPYNKRTSDTINREMERKTDGKITGIMRPELLNDLAEGVIVNGITFSGAAWLKSFKSDKTKKRAFKTDSGQSVQVDTMWTLNNFRYAEVGSLDAKVIELPYQNGDFAMLLLLPDKKDGLRALQQSLVGKNLLSLVESELSEQKVEVHLPKFSVAFGVELEQPFKQLGVTTMFSRAGDFGNMYRMFVSHFINAVNHKAYVEVSEAGVEPSLEATGVLKNLFSRTKKFDADHPFMFAIKHRDSIIFMGHIANYAYV